MQKSYPSPRPFDFRDSPTAVSPSFPLWQKSVAEDRKKLSYLVSVITPTYNGARYLRRVVDSVALQTVPVLEHIIIDDGSSDLSDKILAQLQSEYPHLVVIYQKRKGAAWARNKGISVAQGRYIAFLDADDTWSIHKVERQIGYMEEHTRYFTYGDYHEVDIHTQRALRTYRTPKKVTHDQLLRGCPIGCLTVAYNQEVLGKHYMPEVISGHDWGLWLRLTGLGYVAHKYPGIEANYSSGRKSLSSRKLRKMYHIYRVYRNTEGLSRVKAVFRTLEHSFTALAKKIGLLYS